MLTTPTALVEFLSGTYENAVTFAASKGTSGGYIQSVRKYVKPLNPNTPAQVAVRLAFKNAADFFKNAADKTIGATSFVRADFLDTAAKQSKAHGYRGIPTEGSSAGRQDFIMAAMVKEGELADWTKLAVLPQDMTTEAQLIALNAFISDAWTAVKKRKQRDRIGYIG